MTGGNSTFDKELGLHGTIKHLGGLNLQQVDLEKTKKAEYDRPRYSHDQ